MKWYSRIIAFITLFIFIGLVSWESFAKSIAFVNDSPIVSLTNQKDTLPTVKKQIKSQDIIIDSDTIPDSLAHSRWKVKRTSQKDYTDLNGKSTDLHNPDNLKQTVEYNDSLNVYIIGTKLGNKYIGTPIMMTPKEYSIWSEKKSFADYYRLKNKELLERKGKEKFDFTNMHFALGPAEKIFGPGGVSIRTQGTAEIKFGATKKRIDNPSFPIRNRNTTTMNFDEKINLHVNGKVGDKVNMNLNYNTDATFDFDAQNFKLKYEGKEDEIIKLVEAGNVSFPTNNSLIHGASSLFGLRTDMQFGKLSLQTVFSQKKSTTKSVTSKGGKQVTPFEFSASNYEENRHFFLSHYFRNHYDEAMKSLPNITTGITINRVEIWVTNKTATTSNTRAIIALSDLGENKQISRPDLWGHGNGVVPNNNANSEYETLTQNNADARNIDKASTILDGIGLLGGVDYEKLSAARLLNSSEYSINNSLGYISLRSGIQSDQVIAISYEYTYNGKTYQVGEFASDHPNIKEALYVKSLKNTNNSPRQPNWDLMMKNVYYLASNIERDKFRLDIKYQSDTTGVYLSYIPEPQVKNQQLIRLLGADRLDNNNKPHPNGYFDFVEGYTVNNGRIFLPAVEPFGSHLYKCLLSKGVSSDIAKKYLFTELYDSTKTVAKQIAEKDKYNLVGQWCGTSANVISLDAYNVPQGSVVVTAGGVKLTEGSDYSVDYSAGEVTILNQSIIDAGTNVNVSLESQSDYSQERKTMMGLNWQYNFSKNFILGGTFMHLSEQALTTKVNIGTEPLMNTLWGLNLSWKKESQLLTNILDKLPFLHLTQPSHISFTAEFAHLIAGQSNDTQDHASYLDDFENTKSTIDVSQPTSWTISSVPTDFPESSDKTTLRSGFNRSLLAWYTIDPLFTRMSSTLTPAHIKSDLKQLSNHYVREVYVQELFPNRNQSSYSGTTATIPVLNLAFYPTERGPYNFNTSINSNGRLTNPRSKWGGMMRKLDTNDFETANIEYIEFWMLDPFIYSNKQNDKDKYGGDFYIDLGEISEDVLKDGRKFYESGMPTDGSKTWVTTQWGKIPTQSTVTYSFATIKGSRVLQDVGLNGLTDSEEQKFPSYQDFLTYARTHTNQAVFDSIWADPANDDYHYYRGTDLDNKQTSILDRYKRINNPQGNSPDSDNRSERYDTSYKTMPDVEDINQDYTLNEYERYYQYKISIRPKDMIIGHNYIVDKRETSVKLRDNKIEKATWYQFRIPLSEFQKRVGGINDYTSIRFMRMFLTNFEKPIILRFATLDLVRGEWRQYKQNLSNTVSSSGTMNVSAVNIEENNDKTPVNYVLPPGISREQDPSQPQLVQNNEQAIALTVNNIGSKEAKAVYKNTNLDIRQYKRLQMFVHANAIEPNVTNLSDNQLAVFIRLGSDYKNNYYEYEVPLSLTPAKRYDTYSLKDCKAVWPKENMIDVPLSIFTKVKRKRNEKRSYGAASYNNEFSIYDDDKPSNKITVKGNPTLGDIKTMIIGVRNLSNSEKSGEVWCNELRLLEFNNSGGWAARGQLNLQLSDFGTIDVNASHSTEGFGGLEQGVSERQQETKSDLSLTASLDLGKFFPDKAKVNAPLYYSMTKTLSTPKFNPLDTDMKLSESLASMDKTERDSIEAIAVTKRITSNFALSNVRIGIQNKRHPMPFDPANFSFTYSHSHSHTSGETTVYENEDQWRGVLNYNWSPIYTSFKPFNKLIKSKSKWFDLLKIFELNWLPQNIAVNSDINRRYYELQERNMETADNTKLPLIFNEQFLWNRDFTLRWDLTRNLHFNFQSATHAEIEEPYTPINKELYTNQYKAWKDSVLNSIKNLGTPLDYQQNLTISYRPPINLLPIFDWVNSDANYNSTYTWVRGTKLQDGTSLGNIITVNRTLNANANLNFERLYNKIPFLRKTNDKFSRYFSSKKRKRNSRLAAVNTNDSKFDRSEINGLLGSRLGDQLNRNEHEKDKRRNSSNKKIYEQELIIKPDTFTVVKHSLKTKRLTATFKSVNGRSLSLKWKKIDSNSLKVFNSTDTTMRVKITVKPKETLDNKTWYKVAQCITRILMMPRSSNISYRNQFAMSLPGFMPVIGDAFGQRRIGNNSNNVLSPGIDFALGAIDEDFIDKALSRDWLLNSNTIATPATVNKTDELRIRLSLEPVRDVKIELNANRIETTARSIQYMFPNKPTTQSGMLTMTTISLGTSFEKFGNANSGYYSPTFEKFIHSLDTYQKIVEKQYKGSNYPKSFGGGKFSPNVGTVNKYSGDVMIPAFIATYTNMKSNGLNIFPKLKSLLPNWTIRYSGLSRLPIFEEIFRSVNINHSYKSIFSIGAYQSYSTWQQLENNLGFIKDPTNNVPIPSSMYNIAQVSISESFSPLLGIDVTMQNNLTARLEYRQTRMLSLSMTSVQINEAISRDWVIGLGYRIDNFDIFGKQGYRKRKIKNKTNNNSLRESNNRDINNNGINHNLNLRMDLSYRKQGTITRDIASATSVASNGNTAFKLSCLADYTLSRMITFSAYYDIQINTPLLTSNSYPTATHDFGISLKLSLTR